MKKLSRREIKLISIIIIIGILGFTIGWTIGYTTALSWAIDQGMELLEINGYNVEIDADTIKAGIAMYTGNFENFIRS